jgi:predicted nucleic acid-binding protein
LNGGYLLDTNIPSELMRVRPEPNVERWVASQDIGALFLNVVSIGELETGFTMMQDAARRARLEAVLDRQLAFSFLERVLPVTRAIATR